MKTYPALVQQFTFVVLFGLYFTTRVNLFSSLACIYILTTVAIQKPGTWSHCTVAVKSAWAEFGWPEGVWLSKSLPPEVQAGYSCFSVTMVGGEFD